MFSPEEAPAGTPQQKKQQSSENPAGVPQDQKTTKNVNFRIRAPVAAGPNTGIVHIFEPIRALWAPMDFLASKDACL